MCRFFIQGLVNYKNFKTHKKHCRCFMNSLNMFFLQLQAPNLCSLQPGEGWLSSYLVVPSPGKQSLGSQARSLQSTPQIRTLMTGLAYTSRFPQALTPSDSSSLLVKLPSNSVTVKLPSNNISHCSCVCRPATIQLIQTGGSASQ